MEQSVSLFQAIRLQRKIPISEFKKIIVPVIDQITEDPNVFRILEAVKVRFDYTHRHNIGVAILAVLIGKWLGLSKSELFALSLGAILHDVGNLRIPEDILNKADFLREDEFQFIKQHTVFGYDMLKNTVGISNRVALAALQHHEREDGSGYPSGLSKDQIEPISKIIAVADIFHAMFSKRPYREPFPITEIIKQLRSEIFGKLNPVIVSVFIDKITSKFVGRQIVLSDGRKGNIVFLNPYEETKPLVQVNSAHFIDLSRQRKLHIKEIV
jgi:HD-GYP domain-containing protein (c-di-GMP phosphodiesterase class II)